ncbi:MAG: hypothetical protein AMXMBFR7_34640 [Planctomycetota bacterium]
MRQLARKLIPAAYRAWLRGMYWNLRDCCERNLGLRDYLMPPQALIDRITQGDFRTVGREFAKHFVELGGLQPHHKVLDVGSGLGRMAAPLTSYLNSPGEYWGLEITKDFVDWCKSNITPRHSNFHFIHIDIYNASYNPKGKEKASALRFPFENNTFDFIILSSVFTHLLAPEVKNYLAQISRVLKPGGTAFITYFILNEESERLQSGASSMFNFKYPTEGGMYAIQSMPEAAIAFSESNVRSWALQAGLELIEPIHFGNWCGRDKFVSAQDIVIFRKVQNA